MNLIYLFGMPGVGKLTVARKLSNLTGFKIFHNHLTVDLVATLFEFGSESFINLREKIWLETFSEAIKADFADLIFTFAPEKTVPNDFPSKVKNLLEENGGKVIFIELKCSIAELEKRLTNSSRQSFGKLSSLELFRQLNSEGVFNQPKITADFIVDTTNLSPTETAKKILNHIET